MNETDTEIESEGLMERTRAVTNGDLRVDIQRLTTEFRGMRGDIRDLKDAGTTNATERRLSDKRLDSLFGGLSVLRWALGLIGGGCIWLFTNVNEATNTNREQTSAISSMNEHEKVQDTRIQALERSQFADRVKEKQ